MAEEPKDQSESAKNVSAVSDASETAPTAPPLDAAGAAASSVNEPTKKEQILQLYRDGIHDVAELAYLVNSQSSYVADVLRQAGWLQGYFDLYTTTSAEQNIYTRFFRNALAFKTVAAAEESVERINRLYRHFERLGDRAGQHHAMMLALTGMNRARWSDKLEEARVFHDWLMVVMSVEEARSPESGV